VEVDVVAHGGLVWLEVKGIRGVVCCDKYGSRESTRTLLSQVRLFLVFVTAKHQHASATYLFLVHAATSPIILQQLTIYGPLDVMP
jgi:hypothetical protein